MIKTLPTFHLKLSKGVIIGGNAFEKARIHKYTFIVYYVLMFPIYVKSNTKNKKV